MERVGGMKILYLKKEIPRSGDQIRSNAINLRMRITLGEDDRSLPLLGNRWNIHKPIFTRDDVSCRMIFFCACLEIARLLS